jgi:hypothetical protein
MRDGFKRLTGALVFGAMVAVMGCGDYDPPGFMGGSAGTGGAATASAGSDGSTTSAGSGGMGGSAGAPATPSASGCTMNEGGTLVTSFCADAPLNALTQAEQLQLCSDTGAYAAGVIDRAVGCKYNAIVTSASASAPTETEMRAVCAATEMACIQDDAVKSAGASTLCSGVPASCTATVEQYSTCVMDEAVVFEQGATELVSCSMLTLANLTAIYEVPMDATSAPGCMELKAACPTFILPYIN